MTITASAKDLLDAAPEDVGMSSGRLQNLTRLVQGYIDDGKLAGAISLVARHDRVVHFETYGMMDAEAGRPMQPDTIFRIASMTKPIASVALMTLYEEGHFQLDTPLYEFIPAFKDVKVFAGGTADSYDVRDPSRHITVRDVLTHTAGFASLMATAAGEQPFAKLYSDAGIKLFKADGTLAEQAAALARLPLACDPGTRFTYHFGSDVVGHLCEVISGRPLDAFLGEQIFGPLQMADTGFHVSASKRSRLATVYEPAGDLPEGLRFRTSANPDHQAPFEETATFLSGGGGLTSTTANYLRFCRMLARGGELDGVRILGTRTLDYITTNHFPEGVDFPAMGQPEMGGISMSGVGFGLGFAVILDPARVGTLGTAGEYYWGGAFATAFFISPADDLIVIFMTQLAASPYPIRRELRTAVYSAIVD